MRDGQRAHGAGYGDVEEAALFVERAFHGGARVRQQSFLHSHEKDVRKFQPLTTVRGDEGDGVAGVFFVRLAIGVQRDVVEKFAEAIGGQKRFAAVIHC